MFRISETLPKNYKAMFRIYETLKCQQREETRAWGLLSIEENVLSYIRNYILVLYFRISETPFVYTKEYVAIELSTSEAYEYVQNMWLCSHLVIILTGMWCLCFVYMKQFVIKGFVYTKSIGLHAAAAQTLSLSWKIFQKCPKFSYFQKSRICMGKR